MERHIHFPCGPFVLEGLLSQPAKMARIGVIICHPHPLYGGDMHNNVVKALANEFQDAGHATLRFNFRGVGESTGSHDDGKGEQEDVKAAVTALLAHSTVETVAVAGYSFGSMVGLEAGAEDPRVHKLIGVALPVARRDASFLRKVSKPKLLISGDQDSYSPLPVLRALFAGLPEPKTLTIIVGGDHFFAGLESDVSGAAADFLATS